MKIRASFILTGLTLILYLWVFHESPAQGESAASRSFRMQFIGNYIGNRFQQQVMLVKKNKDIIPDEVRALIAEAMGKEKTYEQRMYLLDIAQAMASMHVHWNMGDEGLLHEVETLVKMEIHKEQERKREMEKWKRYEKFIGNFVMNEHRHQMEEEDLTPVIYPHWVHRIWFECKVCHQDIFVMKRGANDISHKHIDRGEQCGRCHNGEVAFGTDRDELCAKCHIAGSPEAEHLFKVQDVDHEKIKRVAEVVGSGWNPENLPEGKIPLDKFGNIDWLKLKDLKVFDPVVSLDEDFEDEIKDDNILFESTSSTLNNVLFSHKVHSTWIKCSTCHPSIFSEELGGNDIKMKDMAAGKYCGHCHGKVSFTFANCLRCHNTPKGEEVEGALMRKAGKKE